MTIEPAIKDERVIDVRPMPQDTGKVLEGGDCGYCCIAGIFDLVSIQAAYEFREAATANAEGGWARRSAMDPYRWKYLLVGLGLPHLELRPPFDHYKRGMAELPWENHNWKVVLRRCIELGDVVVASIRMHAAPPAPPVDFDDPKPGQGFTTDHNVIINGVRDRLIPHKTMDAGTWITEFRVSCSRKGDYWIEWSKLSYWHGLCNCIPINPENARTAYAHWRDNR